MNLEKYKKLNESVADIFELLEKCRKQNENDDTSLEAGVEESLLSSYLNTLSISARMIQEEVQRLIREYPEKCKSHFRKSNSLPYVLENSRFVGYEVAEVIHQLELGEDVPLISASTQVRSREVYDVIKDALHALETARMWPESLHISPLSIYIDNPTDIKVVENELNGLDRLSADNANQWAEAMTCFLMTSYASLMEKGGKPSEPMEDMLSIVVKAAEAEIRDRANKSNRNHSKKFKDLKEITPKEMPYVAEREAKRLKQQARELKAIQSPKSKKNHVREGVKRYLKDKLKRWVNAHK